MTTFWKRYFDNDEEEHNHWNKIRSRVCWSECRTTHTQDQRIHQTGPTANMPQPKTRLVHSLGSVQLSVYEYVKGACISVVESPANGNFFRSIELQVTRILMTNECRRAIELLVLFSLYEVGTHEVFDPSRLICR